MSSGKLRILASCMIVGLNLPACIECESTADCSPGEVCMDGQCATSGDTDTVDTSTWDTGQDIELSEEQCQDLMDNDSDGMTDCADPGCQSYIFCSDAGGADGDTDVDTDTTGDYWEDLYCPGSSVVASDSCKWVTYEGCCDEEGKLLFCENNKLYCYDCPKNVLYCSWNGAEYYACMAYDNGQDPSGNNPIDCDDLVDAGSEEDTD